MSLTNDIETKILKKLTGLERTGTPQSGTVWAKPSSIAGGQPSAAANNLLHLKLFTTPPGETGEKGGAVATNLFTIPFEDIHPATPTAVTYTPPGITNPPPADDNKKYFVFSDEETSGNVTSIGLCDSNGDVIWSESLAGSAVRKYREIDQLRLTKITFGLTGSAICVDLADRILKHIFTNTYTFNEINNTYLAFYDGDPGFFGNSGANEQGTRAELGANTSDSDNTWEIANGTASNVDTITHNFASEARVTHVAIRGAATSGQVPDPIFWRGPLLSPQKLQANDTLAIRPGQLALSID